MGGYGVSMRTHLYKKDNWAHLLIVPVDIVKH